MGRGAHLQRKIQAANESAESFRVVLRITIALLVFTLVFTLLMFLHYKRTISIWPSLHPYHKPVPTTTGVPFEDLTEPGPEGDSGEGSEGEGGEEA